MSGREGLRGRAVAERQGRCPNLYYEEELFMSDMFDLLLTGGMVLNPATRLNRELDVGIVGDQITAIESKLPRENAKKILDVRGCYVTPGLLDFHVHGYWGVNPYGFDADPICLASGVTT